MFSEQGEYQKKAAFLIYIHIKYQSLPTNLAIFTSEVVKKIFHILDAIYLSFLNL